MSDSNNDKTIDVKTIDVLNQLNLALAVKADLCVGVHAL